MSDGRLQCVFHKQKSLAHPLTTDPEHSNSAGFAKKFIALQKNCPYTQRHTILEKIDEQSCRDCKSA